MANALNPLCVPPLTSHLGSLEVVVLRGCWTSLAGACQRPPLRQALATSSVAATVAVVATALRRGRRHGWSRTNRRVCSLAAVGGEGASANAGDDIGRRSVFALAATAAAASGADAYLRASDERYSFSLLAPSLFKETLRTELVPGLIWGFEQVIAFQTVSANIRMTVVRLRNGKLWVSGPLAPTRQLLRLLNELGEVAHLVVAGTALEHKVSLAEFHRIYPKASVWVAPGQNATLADVNIGPVDGVLGQSAQRPPWQEEIDFQVFYVAPPETQGTYSEVAFFHRVSKTLLATDAVLKVPLSPPPILSSYGYDGTPCELSREQWQYKFIAFNFLNMRGANEADLAALAQPSAVVSPLLRFTLYPICQSAASAWVKEISAWPFERVVAAHLDSPFPLRPNEFLKAFGFLFDRQSSWEPAPGQLTQLYKLSEQLDGPAALESSIWKAAAGAV
mmetsp:Transcript_115289/g.311621  ORF Transcript_115289/g.311621 Transcript_115289/m.311621 type:complete len:450 (-) Transcript_115289:314-1663(-)